MSFLNDNDKLLYQAARNGNLAKVEELLFKGAGTGYKDKVNRLTNL